MKKQEPGNSYLLVFVFVTFNNELRLQQEKFVNKQIIRIWGEENAHETTIIISFIG